MLYSGEEPKGRDIATHFKLPQVDQVLPRCEENWDTYKICHERMPYFEGGSTSEGKEDMGERFSSRDEFDGEDSQINNIFYDNPTCFESILWLRLECAPSCHET